MNKKETRLVGGLVGIPKESKLALDALSQELFMHGEYTSRSHISGKHERIYPDCTLTHYPNGTTKESDVHGYTIRFLNGDWKREEEGRTVYWFKENGTRQVSDSRTGIVVYEFEGGQVERVFRDGRSEVVYGDGTVKRVGVDGGEVTTFVDGREIRERGGRREVVGFDGGSSVFAVN